MRKHVTNRTWSEKDLERLKEMVAAGVSAARASVAFRRSIVAVKGQAKNIGCPFPDDRVLKRRRRTAGFCAEEKLHLQ